MTTRFWRWVYSVWCVGGLGLVSGGLLSLFANFFIHKFTSAFPYGIGTLIGALAGLSVSLTFFLRSHYRYTTYDRLSKIGSGRFDLKGGNALGSALKKLRRYAPTLSDGILEKILLDYEKYLELWKRVESTTKNPILHKKLWEEQVLLSGRLSMYTLEITETVLEMVLLHDHLESRSIDSNIEEGMSLPILRKELPKSLAAFREAVTVTLEETQA